MMKVTLILLLTMVTGACYAQDGLTGHWKTIDDHNGEVRSVVTLYEKDGALYGKILRIFPMPGEDPDPVCDKCDEDDPRYGKKIVGMEIVKGLKKDGAVYSGGYILDPEEGRVYRCRMWREAENLMVRGYWGPFYRTQTWKKAN